MPIASHEAAVRLAEASRNHDQLARELNVYGNALRRMGGRNNIKEALALHTREWAVSRQHLIPREEAIARRFMAECLRELGRVKEALKIYQECLSDLAELDEPHEVQRIHCNVGQCHLSTALEEFEDEAVCDAVAHHRLMHRALPAFVRALEVAEENRRRFVVERREMVAKGAMNRDRARQEDFRDARAVFEVHLNIGNVYSENQDFKEALLALQHSVTVAQQSIAEPLQRRQRRLKLTVAEEARIDAAQRHIAKCYFQVGSVYLGMQRANCLPKAMHNLKQDLALSRSFRSRCPPDAVPEVRVTEAKTHLSMADVHYQSGNIAKAIAQAKKAVEACSLAGDLGAAEKGRMQANLDMYQQAAVSMRQVAKLERALKRAQQLRSPPLQTLTVLLSTGENVRGGDSVATWAGLIDAVSDIRSLHYTTRLIELLRMAIQLGTGALLLRPALHHRLLYKLCEELYGLRRFPEAFESCLELCQLLKAAGESTSTGMQVEAQELLASVMELHGDDMAHVVRVYRRAYRLACSQPSLTIRARVLDALVQALNTAGRGKEARKELPELLRMREVLNEEAGLRPRAAGHAVGGGGDGEGDDDDDDKNDDVRAYTGMGAAARGGVGPSAPGVGRAGSRHGAAGADTESGAGAGAGAGAGGGTGAGVRGGGHRRSSEPAHRVRAVSSDSDSGGGGGSGSKPLPHRGRGSGSGRGQDRAHSEGASGGPSSKGGESGKRLRLRRRKLSASKASSRKRRASREPSPVAPATDSASSSSGGARQAKRSRVHERRAGGSGGGVGAGGGGGGGGGGSGGGIGLTAGSSSDDDDVVMVVDPSPLAKKSRHTTAKGLPSLAMPAAPIVPALVTAEVTPALSSDHDATLLAEVAAALPQSAEAYEWALGSHLCAAAEGGNTGCAAFLPRVAAEPWCVDPVKDRDDWEDDEELVQALDDVQGAMQAYAGPQAGQAGQRHLQAVGANANCAARMMAERGDHAAAARYHRQDLMASRCVGDRAGMAIALRNIAGCLLEEQCVVPALQNLRAAARLVPAGEATHGLLVELGRCWAWWPLQWEAELTAPAAVTGKLPASVSVALQRAVACHRASVAEGERLKRPDLRAIGHHNLGAALALGPAPDFDGAVRHLTRSRNLAPDLLAKGRALFGLGKVHAKQGHLDKAAECFQLDADCCRAVKDTGGEITSVEAWLAVLKRARRHQDAPVVVDRLVQLARRRSDDELADAAEAHRLCFERMRDLEAAEARLAAATNPADKLSAMVEACDALRHVNPESGVAMARRVARLSDGAADNITRGVAARCLGQSLLAVGDADEAAPQLQAAADYFKAAGNHRAQARLLLDTATAYGHVAATSALGPPAGRRLRQLAALREAEALARVEGARGLQAQALRALLAFHRARGVAGKEEARKVKRRLTAVGVKDVGQSPPAPLGVRGRKGRPALSADTYRASKPASASTAGAAASGTLAAPPRLRRVRDVLARSRKQALAEAAARKGDGGAADTAVAPARPRASKAAPITAFFGAGGGGGGSTRDSGSGSGRGRGTGSAPLSFLDALGRDAGARRGQLPDDVIEVESVGDHSVGGGGNVFGEDSDDGGGGGTGAMGVIDLARSPAGLRRGTRAPIAATVAPLAPEPAERQIQVVVEVAGEELRVTVASSGTGADIRRAAGEQYKARHGLQPEIVRLETVDGSTLLDTDELDAMLMGPGEGISAVVTGFHAQRPPAAYAAHAKRLGTEPHPAVTAALTPTPAGGSPNAARGSGAAATEGAGEGEGLGRLSLSSLGLGGRDCVAALGALRWQRSLRSLDLSHARVTGDAAGSLARLLGPGPPGTTNPVALESLSLAGCCLADHRLSRVLRSLAAGPSRSTLHNLDVSSNSVGSNAATALRTLLGSAVDLATLLAADCSMSGSAAATAFQGVLDATAPPVTPTPTPTPSLEPSPSLSGASAPSRPDGSGGTGGPRAVLALRRLGLQGNRLAGCGVRAVTAACVAVVAAAQAGVGASGSSQELPGTSSGGAGRGPGDMMVDLGCCGDAFGDEWPSNLSDGESSLDGDGDSDEAFADGLLSCAPDLARVCCKLVLRGVRLKAGTVAAVSAVVSAGTSGLRLLDLTGCGVAADECGRLLQCAGAPDAPLRTVWLTGNAVPPSLEAPELSPGAALDRGVPPVLMYTVRGRIITVVNRHRLNPCGLSTLCRADLTPLAIRPFNKRQPTQAPQLQ